jgi:hypothetical protein
MTVVAAPMREKAASDRHGRTGRISRPTDDPRGTGIDPVAVVDPSSMPVLSVIYRPLAASKSTARLVSLIFDRWHPDLDRCPSR